MVGNMYRTELFLLKMLDSPILKRNIWNLPIINCIIISKLYDIRNEFDTDKNSRLNTQRLNFWIKIIDILIFMKLFF